MNRHKTALHNIRCFSSKTLVESPGNAVVRILAMLALWILPLERSASAADQMDFSIPKTYSKESAQTPASYLKQFPVKDTNQKLPSAKAEELAKLFIAAADFTKSKYNQDMPLDTNVALYKLLLHNFPDVKKAETEHGAIAFLGDIARVLRVNLAAIGPHAPPPGSRP